VPLALAMKKRRLHRLSSQAVQKDGTAAAAAAAAKGAASLGARSSEEDEPLAAKRRRLHKGAVTKRPAKAATAAAQPTGPQGAASTVAPSAEQAGLAADRAGQEQQEAAAMEAEASDVTEDAEERGTEAVSDATEDAEGAPAVSDATQDALGSPAARGEVEQPAAAAGAAGAAAGRREAGAGKASESHKLEGEPPGMALWSDLWRLVGLKASANHCTTSTAQHRNLVLFCLKALIAEAASSVGLLPVLPSPLVYSGYTVRMVACCLRFLQPPWRPWCMRPAGGGARSACAACCRRPRWAACLRLLG
jgi:hypothetical protein